MPQGARKESSASLVDWSPMTGAEEKVARLGRALVDALDALPPSSSSGVRPLDVVLVEVERAVRDYFSRS